jgi:TonB-linked SusC/RagA family outer membrane protein
MKQTILTLLFIFCSLALSAQGIQVKGVVTSADDGQPLPGVSISVKGTATGSLTDAIGAYTINAPANSTLVFSFVGMKTQEILVKSSTTLNVVLQSNTAMMEEVVVVGYGVQKKSVVTGAISTVKSSDLADMPVTRIEDALKGRTSGVTVASSSGVPGADATVNIRGITSINSAAPLYVVDGVPVVGGIDYLNQGDIESIEILKDAASAAIYGTQAAAGVILISTKKGKSGAMQVNYNGYVGTQAPERKLNLLNAQEYATIMREARVAANQNIPADFPTPQSLGAGTDWQSVIFNNNAMIQNHEFNISGGNDKSTYYASVAYFDQEGIVATDISRYQRTTVRLNSAHKVNKWLNFGNNVSYSHIKSKQGFSTNDYFGGVLASAINLDPITTVTQSDLNPATAPYATNLTSIVRDADGYPYSVSKWVGQEMTNPAAYIKTKLGNYGWSDNIVGNIYMEIQPVKGLTFRTSMGTKLAFWGDYSYNPIYFLSNTNSNLSLNSISRSFNRTLVWTFTNTLSYTRSFNNHNLTFMVGTEARDQSNQIGSGSTLNGIPVTSWDQASMNYSVDPSKTSGWGYCFSFRPYKLRLPG